MENAPNTRSVTTGLEVLVEEHLHKLEGARVGLLTVAAAVDRSLSGAVEVLRLAPGVKLSVLFGPEHGVRGEAQAGAPVADTTDPETGLPVYSLYGSRREPPPEAMAQIDVLIVDLVDVGCRYWTYPYTMAHAMKAAAQANIAVIVLDRPNPITGTRTEGNLPDPAVARKINDRPVQIPIRTGLTLGELARLFNEDLKLGCILTVIPCRGWRREQWLDETGLPYVLPSPNTPTLDTLTVYPGTCLIEGTTLSEGRGTTKPFELIGAPGIPARRLADALNERQLPGVRFRPAHFVPVFSKHEGELCSGVQVHVTDRGRLNATAVGVHLLHALKQLAPDQWQWRKPYREGGTHPVDHLYGSSDLRLKLDAGAYPDDIIAGWNEDLALFAQRTEGLLLYE